MTGARRGHVAILMATRDGAAFLTAQLHSLLAQDHDDWSLWISDDGSADATRTIVAAFAKDHPDRRVTLLDGPGRGSMANFMSLLCAPAIRADFFALCDQDDVWLPSRLSRGLRAVGVPGGAPALSGTRTIIADRTLARRGHSPLFARPPGFRNALVQSLAGGNTMTLNAAAREVVRRAGPAEGAVCHDWWLYQLLSGAGARVVYDPCPSLLYRQHGANQIGANLSAAARAERFGALLRGRFRDWNGRNLGALERVAPLLTAETREVIARFQALRARRGPAALAELRRLGLYRQTAAGNLSLGAAALLGLL